MRITLLFIAVTFLTACSTPDQYYRMESPAVPDVKATGLATGIGPVSIPAYIDRPELVFESTTGQLQVPEGHRWSGPVKDEITRVLTTGVQIRKPQSPVLAYPWPPGTELARHIPVSITELTARSGSGVTLTATWEIGSTQRRTTIRQDIEGDGYSAITAAQSAAIDQLAHRIAASY